MQIDLYGMHVEAYLYLLTRWATVLSWKQQIQNGTNFEQGKIAVQGTRQREKTMTRAKSRFKIIYENIFDDFDWLLSAERIFDEKSHFHQP